eukprot:CAMPEP_0113917626 /NCGR_PEP_ID=MMETSP0780_2-20120614/32850_1 /TAXON_ID=652834 /ORGANISM="Palpitomonas bilix" /LENGTH=54 /DNA_ID=CAMNT_0000917243 /DNA_START=539 /DNA_END=703 /DNA_ORIENTATION=+ /assembly_acc=CAM_ASM_000599
MTRFLTPTCGAAMPMPPSGEGDKVNGELAEVRVELTGEAEAASHTGHHSGHDPV